MCFSQHQDLLLRETASFTRLCYLYISAAQQTVCMPCVILALIIDTEAVVICSINASSIHHLDIDV